MILMLLSAGAWLSLQGGNFPFNIQQGQRQNITLCAMLLGFLTLTTWDNLKCAAPMPNPSFS